MCYHHILQSLDICYFKGIYMYSFAVGPKQLKDVGKNYDFFLYELSPLVSFQQKQNDYSLNNEVKYIYWTISLMILSFFCGYVFLYIGFVVQFYCSLQNMWYMYI